MMAWVRALMAESLTIFSIRIISTLSRPDLGWSLATPARTERAAISASTGSPFPTLRRDNGPEFAGKVMDDYSPFILAHWLQRDMTSDSFIEVVQEAVDRTGMRGLLGLRARQRVPAGTTVELWLAISTDEAIRMKTSRDRWIANRYPLIEAGMSRSDCAEWWAARYDRPLERSACVARPFQSRRRWVETKRRWPELFAEAVEIDARLRGGLAFAKAVSPLPANPTG